jgi:hypothetical protein
MTSNKHELSTDQKRTLERSISDFKAWLCKIKKLHVDATDRYGKVTFPRPTAADWIMEVKGSEVRFNTYVTANCSFNYFRMIVLHECFHLFVQGVPNKSDAKRLKDDFGDGFMKLFDIEADYYTAMYYKEVEHASLVDVFALYHEGTKIFGDPNIRTPKVERFIGSVLSIANAYFKNPAARQTTKENDLYLPTITNLPTEERIHILLSRKNHFALGEIQTNYYDFVTLKKCYTGLDGRGVKEYVETLVHFASKALESQIPLGIYNQLHRLPMTLSVRTGGGNVAA